MSDLHEVRDPEHEPKSILKVGYFWSLLSAS
jgi:hypothetical protein